MQIKKTNDVTASHIKVLVHGPAGAGKTRLCATTGGKTVILAAESGLLSLQDAEVDYIEINSMNDLREAFAFVKQSDYEWVCLDSVSEIAEILLASEKLKNKDPRKAYGEMQEQMMGIMRGFRDLPKNIYFSAKQDKVKDEITGGLIFGPSAPGTKIGPAMPYLFDLVFALHTWKDQEGVTHHGLQTQRDAQYEAKDRSGKLEVMEAANLGHIYNKIIKKGN